MNIDTNSSVELPFVPAETEQTSSHSVSAPNVDADNSNSSPFTLEENETPIMMIEETIDDDETSYKDGEYVSKQTIKSGDTSFNITVTVRIENDIIADIKIEPTDAYNNIEQITENIKSHKCEEFDGDHKFGEDAFATGLQAAMRDILTRARA
ncbi:MAG: hypothetical protein IIZ59_04010 [Clostridia bacterium]|nr:hypothetical protein [Clostridia bacterium]